MPHDLLIDPLLSWRDHDGRRNRATLPALMAGLVTGIVQDFPALRAHQFHPWTMFLTQLAAIALRRSGANAPWGAEAEWCEAMLALTDNRHEPWTLVVEDLSAPAFVQPPVPEKDVRGWKVEAYPDELDVLLTTRNHDVKRRQIRSANPELWAYSLVTLQTSQGYPGRGYNRIARMKGGYGSRPRVGVAPNHSVGARFRRDLAVLLEQWEVLVAARGFSDDGLALVWLEPWNGATSVDVSRLSPHFIEICWRIRLRERANRLECVYTTTSERRCAPEVENGDVGDPWAPVERKDGSVFTVGPAGFDFRRMAALAFGEDFEMAPAQRLRPDDSDPLLLTAAALARGQGKTEGLHERTIVVSGHARKMLGTPEGRAELGRRAEAQLGLIKRMKLEVLLPALRQLGQGDLPARAGFDRLVDEIFFMSLFRDATEPAEQASRAFANELRTLAWQDLQEAINRSPLPQSRRYRAISAAESRFEGCMRKTFPDLFSRPDLQTRETAGGVS